MIDEYNRKKAALIITTFYTTLDWDFFVSLRRPKAEASNDWDFFV